MRTAIFVGLLVVAGSIGAHTGYQVSGSLALIIGIVLGFCIVIDVIEAIKNLSE